MFPVPFFSIVRKMLRFYAIAGLCHYFHPEQAQKNDMDISDPVTMGFLIAVIMVNILKYFDVY